MSTTVPYWSNMQALMLCLRSSLTETCSERAAAPARHRAQTQAQRVQLDEALRVELVVGALVVLERHMRHRIEAVRALASDHAGVALVQLQPHPAGHAVLALVDQRLQHPPLGTEPEAVVDQLRIARHELVLQMRRLAIERDALDATVGGEQDRPARRLVHPAGLHADEAVLHQIEP